MKALRSLAHRCWRTRFEESLNGCWATQLFIKGNAKEAKPEFVREELAHPIRSDTPLAASSLRLCKRRVGALSGLATRDHAENRAGLSIPARVRSFQVSPSTRVHLERLIGQ